MGYHKAIIMSVDLGFGDSGKGSFIDYLCHVHGAGAVVRFSGGPQSAHNVCLPDGRHHTFSQFGSGTFVPGCRTLLSRRMLVSPLALEAEAKHLFSLGVMDAYQRLYIDPRCLMVTPFHRAANRLLELSRGDARHGSCGMGIGETMDYWYQSPKRAPLMGDILNQKMLAEKLRELRSSKLEQVHKLNLPESETVRREMSTLLDDKVYDYVMEQMLLIGKRLNFVLDTNFLASVSLVTHVAFEASQGVLLDEWRGFHPYTTWATVTFDNADELIRDTFGNGHVQTLRYGLLRGYMTRHGAGPMPSETPLALPADTHNPRNDWQGGFRHGWLDAVLLRYAISCVGHLDGLVMSCVDQLPENCMVATSYQIGRKSFVPELSPIPDLDYQSELTKKLQVAVPGYIAVRRADMAGKTSELLGVPMAAISLGPTFNDKLQLHPLARCR